VVIEEIDIEGVAILEAENDSPVPAYSHGPKALQVTFEPVQAKTRNVERLGRFGCVERRENTLHFATQRGIDPARIAAFVEPLEAPMPKTPDHT